MMVIEMGTSTIFRRYNDMRYNLANMPKEDLKKLDELNPWTPEKERIHGWEILMELHNGNVHPLIWWYGQLFHLRDAPKLLTKRHYNRYTGKYSQASEWTLLKSHLEREIKALDKEYKKARARQYRKKKSIL